MHEPSKEANNQYLLEIGLEEMPAGMILPAVEQFKKAAEKSLESNRLQSAKVQPFSSPRRLALVISELPAKPTWAVIMQFFPILTLCAT